MAQDKKQMILDAAQRLFSQFGIKKVTTDEIAVEAGVSKATVYRYYKNKQEIFLDVVRIETEQMLNCMKAAIERETSVTDKLRAHLLTKFDKIHELINFYRVTRETWGEHWPHIAEVLEYFMVQEKRMIRDILQEGNRCGEIAIDDVDLVAHVIVVSFKSIEYPWAMAGVQFTLEQVVDQMLDIFMYGVQKRA